MKGFACFPFLYKFYTIKMYYFRKKANLSLSDPSFQDLFTYDLHKIFSDFPKDVIPSHEVL